MCDYNFDGTQFISVECVGSYNDLYRAVCDAFKGTSFSVVEKEYVDAGKIDYFRPYTDAYFFELHNDIMFFEYSDWIDIDSPTPQLEKFIDGVNYLLRDAQVSGLRVMATNFAQKYETDMLHVYSSPEHWVNHLYNISDCVLEKHGIVPVSNIVIDIGKDGIQKQVSGELCAFSCDYHGGHDELCSKIGEAFGEYGIPVNINESCANTGCGLFANVQFSSIFDVPYANIFQSSESGMDADSPPFLLRAFCNALERLALEPLMNSISCFVSRAAQNNYFADYATYSTGSGLAEMINDFWRQPSEGFYRFECAVTRLMCGLARPPSFQFDLKHADMRWENGERHEAASIYRYNEDSLTPLQSKRLGLYRKSANNELPFDGDSLWLRHEWDRASEVYAKHEAILSPLQKARLGYCRRHRELLHEQNTNSSNE
jgi:hypothetical protein